MDESDKKLLEKHGVVVLPDAIDHDAYKLMVEALLDHAGKRVILHCNGNGGSIRDALGIASVIREHRMVCGIISGEAHSGHALVFMACNERYAHPMAAMGVHRSYFDELQHRVDAQYAQMTAYELERAEREICKLYESASNRDAAWWQGQMRNAGAAGMQMLGADDLIGIGAVRPIEEMVPYWRKPVTSENGQGS